MNALPHAYSNREEAANALTHGLGALASAAALVVLVTMAARAPHGDAWRVASAGVFGAMLVLLYTSSTVYHAVRGARAKHVAKILDHASIYLLIAGTYTPFTLLTLRGTLGLSLFVAVWTLALAGVSAEAFWVYRPKWLSAVVYLAMGWMVVLAGGRLGDALPAGGLRLLIGGGLFYTVGTAFYVMKRVPYMHAVWHVFVMAGSACHVLAVVLYVLGS